MQLPCTNDRTLQPQDLAARTSYGRKKRHKKDAGGEKRVAAGVGNGEKVR
jgi:hypothetical protein